MLLQSAGIKEAQANILQYLCGLRMEGCGEDQAEVAIGPYGDSIWKFPILIIVSMAQRDL